VFQDSNNYLDEGAEKDHRKISNEEKMFCPAVATAFLSKVRSREGR
jgi:hypothetical protein